MVDQALQTLWIQKNGLEADQEVVPTSLTSREDREINTELVDRLSGEGYAMTCSFVGGRMTFADSTSPEALVTLLFEADDPEVLVHKDGQTYSIVFNFCEFDWKILQSHSIELTELIRSIVNPYRSGPRPKNGRSESALLEPDELDLDNLGLDLGDAEFEDEWCGPGTFGNCIRMSENVRTVARRFRKGKCHDGQSEPSLPWDVESRKTSLRSYRNRRLAQVLGSHDRQIDGGPAHRAPHGEPDSLGPVRPCRAVRILGPLSGSWTVVRICISAKTPEASS